MHYILIKRVSGVWNLHSVYSSIGGVCVCQCAVRSSPWGWFLPAQADVGINYPFLNRAESLCLTYFRRCWKWGVRWRKSKIFTLFLCVFYELESSEHFFKYPILGKRGGLMGLISHKPFVLSLQVERCLSLISLDLVLQPRSPLAVLVISIRVFHHPLSNVSPTPCVYNMLEQPLECEDSLLFPNTHTHTHKHRDRA